MLYIHDRRTEELHRVATSEIDRRTEELHRVATSEIDRRTEELHRVATYCAQFFTSDHES